MIKKSTPEKIFISKKNELEMDASRDLGLFEEKSNYLILSSPRSGSTLLSRMLYETKMAGDPLEYFNPPIWKIGCRRFNNPHMPMLDFLAAIKRYRTSSNGVFGMKLHFLQFLQAFQSTQINQDMINFLQNANQLIWIKRKNKIYQAISQAIAIQSNVWSSEDPQFEKSKAVSVNNQLITNCLMSITFDELGWQKTLDSLKLNYLEVWYEDLAENYTAESQRVLNYLNISPANIPNEPIQKQGDKLNETLYTQYTNYIAKI